MVLTTFERLGNFVIGNVMAKRQHQANFRSLRLPMDQERNLWYMDLVLTTLERLENIVIGNEMA